MPNTLVLNYTRLEVLAKDKHSSLLGHFEVTKKMKGCEQGHRGRIYNTSFSSLVMHGPNKI